MPLPLTLTRPDRTLFIRLRRWRERLRWARHRLNAVPPGIQIVVLAGTVLAVFSVANVVYQVVRKPTEIFFPVSATMNKLPAETWRQYAPLFREYSTATITPELLAALAQVEGAGNPVARTYWRWRLSWNPFAIYQPASSAVGMYQMTDAAFAEARAYCIHRARRLLVRTVLHPRRAEPRHRAHGGVSGSQRRTDRFSPSGTDGSNPLSSSGESANHRSLSNLRGRMKR